MFCHKCGKEVPSTVVFCHHCGAKLHATNQIHPASVRQGNPLTTVKMQSQKKPINRKKTLITATGVVLAFFCLLVGSKLASKTDIQDKANSVMYLEIYDKNDEFIGTASGFYIENGKTLVTNYHVIDGAHRIVIMSSNEDLSTEATTVRAYDRNADLAILQCKADIGVPPLMLANSDFVAQGDKVYAIGYPLGVANTMSDGIISSRYYDEHNVDVLQITAAISEGSSGGALLNEQGLVIGVTCASYTNGQNLNLAIASNVVQKLYDKKSNSTTLAKLNSKHKRDSTCKCYPF